VINPRTVSQSIPSPRGRRTTSSERAELLRAFDRSGLSAAAFTRKDQINYTTFCGWRQRRNASGGSPGSPGSPEFVEVELPPAAAPSSGLVVEVGAKIRLRISNSEQVPLAATLLKQLAQQEEAC
jgi:hypothetical protein